MTYLSPLGYLLGIEGAALLRGFREGSAGRAFVETRIAEIRALLDTPALAQAEGVTASPGTISVTDVYRSWAPHYDAPGNQMIDIEQRVLAEFARVLRPGGSLVISDAHLLVSYLRPTLARRPGPDGRPSLLTEHHRPLSAYLAAALPLGFQVRQCEEPRRPRHSLDPETAPDPLPAHMSWDLLHWCPEASAAALDDSPIAVVWRFQLDGVRKAEQPER
ncbi:hypothetical protein [Streptomyces coeruleorubidus]|uniref:Uncharacterized protein n=1 Tax=Streptomyces coeruleorubidus TaxID=116188 RepID=A0A5J6HWE1_STRC4|nr:hypothetical protein [Streptomyces coeruleorubidus]QEV23144.1 hypothetical protein CP976_02465 [Streptomyces coeruleorubidus]